MVELRMLMVSLFVFSGVILGMSSFYVDLYDNESLSHYGLNASEMAEITPEDLSHLSQATDLTERSKQMKASLDNKITGIPGVDLALGYVIVGFQALTTPFEVVNLFTNTLETGVEYLGLPGWFGGLLLGIVITIAGFALISAFLKWRV